MVSQVVRHRFLNYQRLRRISSCFPITVENCPQEDQVGALDQYSGCTVDAMKVFSDWVPVESIDVLLMNSRRSEDVQHMIGGVDTEYIFCFIGGRRPNPEILPPKNYHQILRFSRFLSTTGKLQFGRTPQSHTAFSSRSAGTDPPG